MSAPNELREKIVEELENWILGEIDQDHGTVQAETVADSILALLPKIPELQWDNNCLCLGNLNLGYNDASIQKNGDVFMGWLGDDVVGHGSEQEARSAVEAAVRKALGW